MNTDFFNYSSRSVIKFLITLKQVNKKKLESYLCFLYYYSKMFDTVFLSRNIKIYVIYLKCQIAQDNFLKYFLDRFIDFLEKV